MECKFELSDLKRIIYWTTCKFRIDKFHHTSVSAKRDVIGGFFDRWVNRASEFVVFKNLLKEKNYEAGIDFFFYGQETEKNAPDLIGLQDKNGNVLVKFAEYDNGTWLPVQGAPWIEVKTFRKDQYLTAVKESQMDDEHFYVMVESSIRDDYLITILDKSVFDDEISGSFKMSKAYIRSDTNQSLIEPEKITPSAELGSFKLIGVFKGKEVKKYCLLCKGKTEDANADQPRYIHDVEKLEGVNSTLSVPIQEGLFSYSFDGGIYLPAFIKFLSEGSEVKLLRKKKTFFYLHVKGKVTVNEHELGDGAYKVNFRMFARNAGYSEWIGYKYLFEKYAESSEQQLLEMFDRLVTRKPSP